MLNLKGVRHIHLVLKMMDKEYMEHTGFVFLSSHNPGDCPQSMGSAQKQALVTQQFQQNQALFRNYIAMDGSLKKQIVTSVEPVFLSPLVDQITYFGQVSALTILQHLCSSYGVINEIELEENAVNMMGPYNASEPISQPIKKLEKGRELARSGGQKISDLMMMSKGITLLAQTGIFNDDFRD